MGKKVIKTLYFVTGVVPSDEQQAEIDVLPGQICVRNVTMLNDDGALEDFDKVAGDVPPRYAAEAERRAVLAGDAPNPPLASSAAPAAPQQGAAKPTGAKPGTAWKPN